MNLNTPARLDPPLVVIGASAGGVEALVRLVASLTFQLDAPVVVVLHVPATGRSLLPEILGRSGPLAVATATDGASLRRNHILVAPPDRHVLVGEGHVVLSRGPRENGSRPAVDPLFRSAARAYGRRTVGVLLSGALDDGVAGLLAIQRAGGTTIAQEPADAMNPSMPTTAIAHGAADHVAAADAVGPLLLGLTHEVPSAPEESLTATTRLDLARDHRAAGATAGRSTPYTCPECGGVLWEQTERELLRFRCQVGHSYSLESMLEQQSRAVEEALWSALRILEERAAFLRRMADRHTAHGDRYPARDFGRRADAVGDQATVIRQALAGDERAADDQQAAVSL